MKTYRFKQTSCHNIQKKEKTMRDILWEHQSNQKYEKIDQREWIQHQNKIEYKVDEKDKKT